VPERELERFCELVASMKQPRCHTAR
jgi:hypothetical protein